MFGPDLSSMSLRVETEMGVLRSRSLTEDVVDSLELMVRLVEPRGEPRDRLLEQIYVERWASSETYRFDRIDAGTFAVEADRMGSVDTVSVGETVVTQGTTFRLTPAVAEHERVVVSVTEFPDAVASVRSKIRVTRPDRAAAIVAIGYDSSDTLLVDEGGRIKRCVKREATYLSAEI